ncbi:DUF4365 domain-containing protein [Vibrio parahaemolyticus]
MKFDINASHGKAGEYYFAYWICNNFGWPCRLLDIDVGIDAQIEVFNENYHSTGDFIGVQVKTTMYSNPNVSIPLKSLEYWASIEDPVILVSITLEGKPKIYWKLINGTNINERINDIKNKGNKTGTVSFSIDDELLISNKDNFTKLNLMKICSLLDKKCEKFNHEVDGIEMLFQKEWSRDEMYIETDPIQLGLDKIGMEHCISDFDSFFDKFMEINDLVISYPELKGLSSSYKNIIVKFETVKRYIDLFISKVSELDVDYSYEIRDNWKVSSTNKILLEILEENY